MSFTAEKRKRIKNYLMEKIFKKSDNYIIKAVSTFEVSKTSIYKYLSELEKENKIVKTEDHKYKLVNTIADMYKFNLKDEKLEEDKVYEQTLEKHVSGFSKNVVKIWEYSFMEMFNNVIDHSEANNVYVYIGQNALYTWVNIRDDGIGIFEKISRYYKYNDLDEAILGLFKGKLTTDKENHSGEGIFFTSRVMDHFGAISSNKVFTQDNTMDELCDLEGTGFEKYKDKKGTLIVMALSNDSPQTLKEVFDMYSSVEGGFTVTKVPMKHVCDSGYPVSRSQAKRLYFGFENFETVILDFSGVDDIGQGFAHELFYVFKRKHPNIDLKCINTNKNIEKMIRHVTE